jgi:predicted dienelactone hydrolase
MDTPSPAGGLTRRTWLSQVGLAGLAFPAAATEARDGAFTDVARGRTLPWRLRLPPTPGPWPLALFSHGLGGSRSGGAAWGEAWSAAGIASLHLQHPGSDSEVLRGGRAHMRAAATAEQLIARVVDVRFVLDDVARRAGGGEAPWSAMQLEAVGLSGHSFGAHTAQAVAGQRYARGGSLADPRPRAFIAFSPSQPARGGLTLQQSFGGITRPFLAVTGSLDGDPFGSFDSGEPRAAVFDGLPPGQRALLWLDGADHMTFGGGSARLPQVGPFRRQGPAAERQEAHHAVVAHITTLWWRAHLMGDATALRELAAPLALVPGDRYTRG